MVKDAVNVTPKGREAWPKSVGVGGFAASGHHGSSGAVPPSPAQLADQWGSVPIYATTSMQTVALAAVYGAKSTGIAGPPLSYVATETHQAGPAPVYLATTRHPAGIFDPMLEHLDGACGDFGGVFCALDELGCQE